MLFYLLMGSLGWFIMGCLWTCVFRKGILEDYGKKLNPVLLGIMGIVLWPIFVIIILVNFVVEK